MTRAGLCASCWEGFDDEMEFFARRTAGGDCVQPALDKVLRGRVRDLTEHAKPAGRREHNQASGAVYAAAGVHRARARRAGAAALHAAELHAAELHSAAND